MDLRPLLRRFSGFSLFGALKGSKDFKRFAAVHISFLFFTTLSSVFINTFFMKNTGDMRASILFNLFNILTAMVFMNIAAPICSKTSPRTVVILGVIAYNLEYAFVLFMGDASSNYVVLVGLLNGLGGVFYWLGYYNLLTDTTKDANRDQALSVFGIVLALSLIHIFRRRGNPPQVPQADDDRRADDSRLFLVSQVRHHVADL